MIPVVLKQEIVADDYVALAEKFDLGATELPWHFDYFAEDAEDTADTDLESLA